MEAAGNRLAVPTVIPIGEFSVTLKGGVNSHGKPAFFALFLLAGQGESAQLPHPIRAPEIEDPICQENSG